MEYFVKKSSKTESFTKAYFHNRLQFITGTTLFESQAPKVWKLTNVFSLHILAYLRSYCQIMNSDIHTTLPAVQRKPLSTTQVAVTNIISTKVVISQSSFSVIIVIALVTVLVIVTVAAALILVCLLKHRKRSLHSRTTATLMVPSQGTYVSTFWHDSLSVVELIEFI